jgi:hypothetical protein
MTVVSGFDISAETGAVHQDHQIIPRSWLIRRALDAHWALWRSCMKRVRHSKICRAGPDNRDDVLALPRRAFGRDAPDRRLRNWVFLANPSGTEMRYLVAEAEGRIGG